MLLNKSDITLLLMILLVTGKLGNTSRRRKKSCISTCHEHKFPPCGAWLHMDNALASSGNYLLGEGEANLTCVVNSLPRPTLIHWLHRADFQTEWSAVRCSSLRTVTDCRFNQVGEHKVTSVCLLRTHSLGQSGVYRCSAVGSEANDSDGGEKELATSAETRIDVHGIGNVTLGEHDMRYGRIGSIAMVICANPKPNIIWFNEELSIVVQAGQTVSRYTALPLEPVSRRAPGDRQGPSNIDDYCYVAKLFSSTVTETDRRFVLTVTNQAHTVHEFISVVVRNAPNSAQLSCSSTSVLVIVQILILVSGLTC